MKLFWKILPVGMFLLSAWAGAADLTATVSTDSGQLYNKMYRDTKDGTTAETKDSVSANTYVAVGSTVAIKATGGYLDNIQWWQACQNAVKIADAAAVDGGNNYAVVIATVPANFAAGNIPLHIRFTSGLVWANAISTCTATISYR